MLKMIGRLNLNGVQIAFGDKKTPQNFVGNDLIRYKIETKPNQTVSVRKITSKPMCKTCHKQLDLK